MRINYTGLVGVIGALSLPTLAVAALSIPHSFHAGDVISAQEMNENFAVLKAEVESLQARLDALEAPPAWTAVTFEANWADKGSGHETVAYWKDAHGFVHLKGLAQLEPPGASDSTIFTLPVGYRPSNHQVLPAIEAGNTEVPVTIGNDGRVHTTDATLAPPSWLSLAGMSFPAAP